MVATHTSGVRFPLTPLTVRINLKIKNTKHRGSPEYLQKLKDELDFIGRDSVIQNGVLIVFAIDRKHGKRKAKGHQSRDKRNEKFQNRRPKSDDKE